MRSWQWRIVGGILAVGGMAAFFTLWYLRVPQPFWLFPVLVAAGGAILLAFSIFDHTVAQWAATLFVAVLALVGAFVAIPVRQDSPEPEITDSRPPYPEGCEQGKVNAEIHRESDGKLNLHSFTYTLHHGKLGDWVYVDLFGNISGNIPEDSHLYLFAWADPTTNGIIGKGNNLYQWLDNHEITRSSAGCWSISRLELGYPGFEGITVRYYPAVVSKSQAGCLTPEIESETKDGNRDGLPLNIVEGCGVKFLGYWVVPTGR
jgi:hypothetical protein